MYHKILVMLGLLYVFGIQRFVVGYLMQNPTRYQIGGIGFVLLVIGGIIYAIAKKKNQKSIFDFDKRKSSVHWRHGSKIYAWIILLILMLIMRVDYVFIGYGMIHVYRFVVAFIVGTLLIWPDVMHKRLYVGKKLFMPKDMFCWFSVGLAILAFIFLQGILPAAQYFVAILFGFLVYLLSMSSKKVIGVYSVWRLLPTRLYILALIVSGVLMLVQFYAHVSRDHLISSAAQRRQFAQEYIAEGFTTVKNKFDTVATGDYVLEGTGNVVGTSALPTVTGTETATGYVDAGTGSVMSGAATTGDTLALVEADNQTPLTFGDVIPGLIERYEIPVTNSTNLSFTYVSRSNALYPYFVAAFNKKMIGKTTNPVSEVKCDTYIVMKGIAADWEVTDLGSIFDTYRAAAERQGELNGCERGVFVTEASL